MTTVLDMVKRSMRLIRVLGQGETPTDSEAQDGLSALNTMLEAWSIERLMVYQILDESFTWTGGQSSRTMGPSGNFDTSRPTKVTGFYIKDAGIDYHAEIIGRERYDSIADKASGSTYPEYIYPQMGVPLVTLYAFPVPSGTQEAHVLSWKRLQAFTSLTDELSLPPGYQRAIEFNLGVEFAPDFGRAAMEAARDIAGQAALSKSAIKRLNAPEVIMGSSLTPRRYNINSDE